MNRRQLMTAAPALCCVGVTAAGQGVTSHSSVRAQFQRWQAYAAWLDSDATAGMADAEFDAAVDVHSSLEEAMIATPSQGADDIILKIAAYTDFGNGSLPEHMHLPQLWDEIRSFFKEGGAA